MVSSTEPAFRDRHALKLCVFGALPHTPESKEESTGGKQCVCTMIGFELSYLLLLLFKGIFFFLFSSLQTAALMKALC